MSETKKEELNYFLKDSKNVIKHFGSLSDCRKLRKDSDTISNEDGSVFEAPVPTERETKQLEKQYFLIDTKTNQIKAHSSLSVCLKLRTPSDVIKDEAGNVYNESEAEQID